MGIFFSEISKAQGSVVKTQMILATLILSRISMALFGITSVLNSEPQRSTEFSYIAGAFEYVKTELEPQTTKFFYARI